MRMVGILQNHLEDNSVEEGETVKRVLDRKRAIGCSLDGFKLARNRVLRLACTKKL